MIALRTKGSAEITPSWVQEESDALRKLEEKNRDYPINAPRLLAVKFDKQEHWSWVPGGYACFIVMTLCPGKPFTLSGFYRRPISEREVIRQSFKATLL